MKAVFKIEYHAQACEWMCLVADGVSYAMDSADGRWWRVKFNVSKPINYHYELRCGATIVRSEGVAAQRPLSPDLGIDLCLRWDTWLDGAESLPFSSSLFSKSINRREPHRHNTMKRGMVVVECKMGAVKPEHSLAIVGESPALGGWKLNPEMIMCDASFPLWRVSIPNSALGSSYKFVLINRKTQQIIAWEEGENRKVEQEVPSDGSAYVFFVRSPRISLPLWRGKGVSIPVFSLRSERSMGVGDFEDLKLMADWAASREMSVLQILPINDTMMYGTWEDSYPYNANSNIALHPQYLALRSVAQIKDEQRRNRFESTAKDLNALSEIDYERMMEFKMEYLREAYSQEREEVKKRESYEAFRTKNDWWLKPHALFSYLRDHNKTPHFELWGEESTFSKELLFGYFEGEKSKGALVDLEFYIYLQYHLHEQLKDAAEYARSLGVAIKGDIPIGISRTSVDAWQSPQLFKMEMQTGAPPDAFSAMGQNWGFPTYNWEQMARDGFSWWRQRMQKMAEYFDAYRIDHILGFFRIWEIPHGTVHGLTGHFNPALPFSVAEIAGYGFNFKISQTEPIITLALLEKLGLKDVELSEFLDLRDDGTYKFKSKYSTQLAIKYRFKNDGAQNQDSQTSDLAFALMSLHDEKLFVYDKDQGGYHPRILGFKTLAFQSLADDQQAAYRALHDDFYYRRHNDFWRESALTKLPSLICSTQMLVCGEDLGMIPACVPSVMQELQILSLEIERMPKEYGQSYAEPVRYPYLSVCTTSTHDMSPIRAWWREDREQVQTYYNYALKGSGEAPEDCSAELAQIIVKRNLASGSMLTILPLQDWIAGDGVTRNPDPMAERINIPANPRHYWRWRMHISLDNF